jgi:hypothetical protein
VKLDNRQKLIFVLLLLISIVVFGLFIPPNAVASKNLAMVQIFQPDEAAVFPSVINMIAPAGSLYQALHSFVFYGYYFYGFPYFALSAVVLLPLRFTGNLADLSTAMLLLRQLISVLPMLAALLFLVFMQDGFRTYRSIVLYIFLLSVPAVVQNNLWWHPDGIVFLLIVLTLFFLLRDNLRLGKNFMLAAVMCGIATATKLIGLYYFLAIGLVLILSTIQKKATWKRVIGMAFAFLLVLAATFLISNPFLISSWARTSYYDIFRQQTALLSEGYTVFYAKGPAAAWSLLHATYGEIIFLLVALGTGIWGSIWGPKRLLHGIILAWFIPLTVSVLWLTHFKFQYWLPAALPLFSCLILVLPEKWQFPNRPFQTNRMKWLIFGIRILLLAVVLGQFVFYVINDVQLYRPDLTRAENNPRIDFYSEAVDSLKPLSYQSLNVYYDYRLYVPATSGWTTTTTYDLLDYGFIQEGKFGVLLLLEQRIRDYLNPNVTGINPEEFAKNQQFYKDAENGTINGYELVFRNSVGLVFVDEARYQQYFQK